MPQDSPAPAATTTASPAAPAAAPRKRDLSIHSLRGLAVILLVGYHASKSGSSDLTQPIDFSWWNSLLTYGGDLRMPLFTVLSGFVYAMRPLKLWSGYPQLVKGKVKRLLVPFFVVGSLYFLWQVVGPGDELQTQLGDIGHFYLYGDVGPYWFLQAVFWCFLAVGALDAAGRLQTVRQWAVVSGVAFAVYVAFEVPLNGELLNYGSALWLFPFFLLGLGVKRYPELTDARFVWPAAAAVAVALAVRVGSGESRLDIPWPLVRLASLVIGACGIWLLLQLRQKIQSRALGYIGQYSFSVFLFHTFALSAVFFALPKAGLTDPWVLLVIGTGVGIAAPIAFEQLFGRYAWVSWPLLGQKPKAPQRAARVG